MNFKLPKNSLFAILLRSRWWISTAIGTVLGLIGVALLPESLRIVGALSGFPFLVIGALAARRQWRLPSPQQVDKCREEVAALAWPAFAARLEAAFAALRYGVEPVRGSAADFVLHRDGRRTLVSARRWKSARVGLETLRALQEARQAADVSDAVVIALGELTDTARPYATQHRIAVWQAADLAYALRGPAPGPSTAPD